MRFSIHVMKFPLSPTLSLNFLLISTVCAAAAVPVPLNRPAPVPLNQVRVGNPAVLPLAGTWKFSLAHGRLADDGFHGPAASPATASSSQSGNSPDLALDKREGKWCADGGEMPQWWMVDLGSARELSGLNIEWEFDNAIYQFKVEGSLDKTAWKLLADKTADGAKSGPVEIKKESARYLKITVTGAKRGGDYAWACIKNVQIQVLENGQTVDWKPTPVVEDPTKRDAFAATGWDDKTWADIAVPANWEMLGFSPPTYDQPDDAVGLYRRWVEVPATFAGQRVLWHFDGVFAGAEIFVNGQPIGVHDSGFTAFDVDVTAALKPGQRNLLAVRVSKKTPSVDLDTGDFWSLGGIYRENYLLALPETHVSDVAVTTDLDDQYRDATLKSTVTVSGKAGAPVSLDATLMDSQGKIVAGIELKGQGVVGADGQATIPLQALVKAPRLWSAEKPDLYFLAFTLGVNGRVVERFQQRFGFREIQIKDVEMLWNGVPIKCTGVNHHEEWADKGHALDEENWKRDLTLMKSFNVNAIRTSHYNPASRFLELCDEMGFYVLDEVPFCWADSSNPQFKAPFLQRARETLARDKNHASVMAWSLGNESGYGPVNAEVYKYVKAADPTRPAFISQAAYWTDKNLDFADFHYPWLKDMKWISEQREMPSIMTEQPHIFYVPQAMDYDYGAKDLWGQVLARNWDYLWGNDHIVGSYVWEWQDQGLADKGRTSPGLRGDNNKGLVDGYRNPKPETWHLKMVYSPVTISEREISAVAGTYLVKISNRYAFTNLAELTCRWQALQADKVVAQGEKHLDCAPRTTMTANFPVTAGADTLRLEWIHPDGRSVYATRLHVAGMPLLPAAPGGVAAVALALQDKADEVRIESADMQIVLDKKSGQLRFWRSGNRDLLVGGPILNLGEARQTTGETRREKLRGKQSRASTQKRGRFGPSGSERRARHGDGRRFSGRIARSQRPFHLHVGGCSQRSNGCLMEIGLDGCRSEWVGSGRQISRPGGRHEVELVAQRSVDGISRRAYRRGCGHRCER